MNLGSFRYPPRRRPQSMPTVEYSEVLLELEGANNDVLVVLLSLRPGCLANSSVQGSAPVRKSAGRPLRQSSRVELPVLLSRSLRLLTVTLPSHQACKDANETRVMWTSRLQRAAVDGPSLRGRKNQEEAPGALAPPRWVLSVAIGAESALAACCLVRECQSREGENGSSCTGGSSSFGHRYKSPVVRVMASRAFHQ